MENWAKIYSRREEDKKNGANVLFMPCIVFLVPVTAPIFLSQRFLFFKK